MNLIPELSEIPDNLDVHGCCRYNHHLDATVTATVTDYNNVLIIRVLPESLFGLS